MKRTPCASRTGGPRRCRSASRAAVNRSITEGRRAFLKRFTSIESGAECERLAPLISKAALAASAALVAGGGIAGRLTTNETATGQVR